MFNQALKQENKENLSYNMYAGAQRAQLTRENTIFIVGQSRVGKSTLFNHVVGIRLKGIQVKKHNIIYQADMHDQAESKYSFKSVTILPNIKDIEINKETLAIQDMAGYNDRNRSFTGVFMVSYMLVQSFKFAKNAKFILVIQEANITLSKFQDIIKPFANFVNMFKLEQLYSNEEIMNNLMSSVVLVITRATKKYEDTQSRLTQIFQELQDQEEKTTQQKLISQLLRNCIQKKKFYLFDKAKKDQYAPACTLFQDMQNKDWQYFRFQQNQNLIEIPFARDYDQLSQKDKTKYQQFQIEKLNLYEAYSQIVTKFLNKALDHSSANKIDYSKELVQLDKFVQDNDRYEDQKMIQKLQIEMTKPQTSLNQSISGFTLLNKLSEANKIFQQISQYLNARASIALREFQVLLKKVMAIFMEIFCHCRKEEVTFMKSIFIYIQSIQEFASIDEVDLQKGAMAVQKIKDCFLQIMPDMVSILVEYLRNCEPNEKNLDQIQAKLDDLIKNKCEDFPNYIDELKRKQIKVKILRGDFQIKKYQYSSSLSSYIKALDCLQNQKAQSQNKDSKEQMQFFNNQLIQIYSKVGKCLQGMKIYTLAFEIFKKIGFINQMDNSLHLMQKSEKQLQTKYEIMLRYGSFCQQYGRVQDAVKIYQRMHQNFYFNSQYRKVIFQCINRCLLEFTEMKFTAYRDTLASEQNIDNDEDLIKRVLEEQDKYESSLDKSIHTHSETHQNSQN